MIRAKERTYLSSCVLLLTIATPTAFFLEYFFQRGSNSETSSVSNSISFLLNEPEISFSHEILSSYSELEPEALQVLEKAIEYGKMDRPSKALKLFVHALALSPKHPKILNHYGEFLETASQLIEADHCYVRALAFSTRTSEDHGRALSNRQRTSVRVQELDLESLSRIDAKKLRFQQISHDSSSLKRAKREAYYQHIYHSVGLEGNTLSLAQTRSILETKVAIGGKSLLEHNEVLGLDEALKYINQTLVDKVGEISLSDILSIHKRVVGFVNPVEAGLIRKTQVFVGDHVPPDPSLVPGLLHRFIDWLKSSEALSLHPIRLAALAHYKLVFIHPFVDGNGRTSRLLMNLILMQNGFPPVIIRKEDRWKYYQTLSLANEGDIRPFIRFISYCTERTLDAYEASNSIRPLFPIDSEQMNRFQKELDFHDTIILGVDKCNEQPPL